MDEASITLRFLISRNGRGSSAFKRLESDAMTDDHSPSFDILVVISLFGVEWWVQANSFTCPF